MVRLSIEEFESKRVKYYYKGESLFDFCKRTPNLSYSSVVDYIHRKKEDNPTLDNHEIIELYLNENHGQYRYYYQGVPFKLYCDRNDINYENVMNYISRHRKDKDYIDLSDDELIENIMLHYQPFKPKYMYKNVTLYSYCKKKNLPYYSIVSYINSKCEKNKSLDIERVIDEAIITIHKHGIIYYYNGTPLKDYCLQNGLNVHSIRGAIWEKKKIVISHYKKL